METLQKDPPLGQTLAVNGGLYAELLGEEFSRLHPGVQRSLSAPLAARGRARVVWGDSCLARILRMPHEGDDIPVTLQVSSTPRGLRWHRQFGDDVFRTSQKACRGFLFEHMGMAATVLKLEREDDSLRFTSVAGHMLGLCAPQILSPQVDALLCGLDEHRWHVHVVIYSCRRLICQYEAQLEQV